MQGLKSAILAIFQTGPGWPCPVSTALKNSSLEFNNSFCFGFVWIPSKCWKAKLERAYSFRVQSGKITVWFILSVWKVKLLRVRLNLFHVISYFNPASNWICTYYVMLYFSLFTTEIQANLWFAYICILRVSEWNFFWKYVWIHGLRTPNEGINQRNLKIWTDVADKIICFGRT